MKRTRVILGLVLLGLMLGGLAISESGMAFELKVLTGSVALMLFMSAGILMGITFFVLDGEGRIPYGSLTWRYFASFYARNEKTPDGKEVRVVRMPERIKLCPSFWMVFAGLILVAVVSLVAFGVLMLAKDGFTNGFSELDKKTFWDGFVVIGVIFAIIAFLVLVTHLLGKVSKTLVKIWGYFWLLVLAALILGGPPYLMVHRQNMTVGEAAVKTALGWGELIVTIVAAIVVIILLVLAAVGIVSLICRILPWARNSLFVRILAAIYRGLCPVIPVAPAPLPAMERSEN